MARAASAPRQGHHHRIRERIPSLDGCERLSVGMAIGASSSWLAGRGRVCHGHDIDRRPLYHLPASPVAAAAPTQHARIPCCRPARAKLVRDVIVSSRLVHVPGGSAGELPRGHCKSCRPVTTSVYLPKRARAHVVASSLVQVQPAWRRTGSGRRRGRSWKPPRRGHPVVEGVSSTCKTNERTNEPAAGEDRRDG